MAALSRLNLLQTVYRTFYIQGSWNYERMLNLGFCFSMIPYAKERLKNQENNNEFYERNLSFFNTHPYMAGWLVGVSLNFEEKILTNEKDIDVAKQNRMKKMMSESLAAVGDQLYWARLKPISAMIGFMLSLLLGIAGPIIFFVLYNIPHLHIRIKSVFLGYREGTNIVKYFSFKKHYKLIDRLLKVGAFFTGIMLVVVSFLGGATNMPYISAVIVSSAIMYFSLRKNISVPISILMILFINMLVGLIIG